MNTIPDVPLRLICKYMSDFPAKDKWAARLACRSLARAVTVEKQFETIMLQQDMLYLTYNAFAVRSSPRVCKSSERRYADRSVKLARAMKEGVFEGQRKKPFVKTFIVDSGSLYRSGDATLSLIYRLLESVRIDKVIFHSLGCSAEVAREIVTRLNARQLEVNAPLCNTFEACLQLPNIQRLYSLRVSGCTVDSWSVQTDEMLTWKAAVMKVSVRDLAAETVRSLLEEYQRGERQIECIYIDSPPYVPGPLRDLLYCLYSHPHHLDMARANLLPKDAQFSVVHESTHCAKYVVLGTPTRPGLEVKLTRNSARVRIAQHAPHAIV